MKKIFQVIMLLVMVQECQSQKRETFQLNQIAAAKKFVNFIFIGNDKNNLFTSYGTGFFIGKKIDSQGVKLYLATSKHVLKDSNGLFINKIFLRYNLKNGGAGWSELNLFYEGKNKNVHFHSDSTVDLALMPLHGDFNNLDFSYLSVDNMLVKSQFEKNGIAEGTEVFFTGLFSSYFGEKRNFPITRFGKISLIPEEKISFVDAKRDVIFLETTAYGGNSGSPVFISYEWGGFHIRKLIGVMTGSFDEFNKTQLLTNAITISKENSGISVITPCNFLIDLINSIE